eukprot:8766279-Pyramimonas_sp.AAC.2
MEISTARGLTTRSRQVDARLALPGSWWRRGWCSVTVFFSLHRGRRLQTDGISCPTLTQGSTCSQRDPGECPGQRGRAPRSLSQRPSLGSTTGFYGNCEA